MASFRPCPVLAAGGITDINPGLTLWTGITFLVPARASWRKFAWGPIVKMLAERERHHPRGDRVREEGARRGGAAPGRAEGARSPSAQREAAEIAKRNQQEVEELRQELTARARKEADELVATARRQIERGEVEGGGRAPRAGRRPRHRRRLPAREGEPRRRRRSASSSRSTSRSSRRTAPPSARRRRSHAPAGPRVRRSVFIFRGLDSQGRMGLSIGIVGLPNVGKSTLFNALLGAAQAAAANYPFCTIEPNVGVVPVPDRAARRALRALQAEEDHPDHARVRGHRRPRRRRVEGRGARQPVPRQHPPGRRDRPRAPLLRRPRRRPRRRQGRPARRPARSSRPSSC